jgi:hypothetical protein
MPAGKYDFDRITQGDTILETFAFTTDGETPYDLTGATIRTQFRDAPVSQGGSVVIDATSYWTIDDDPTTGRATLEVPASDTATIDTSASDGTEPVYLVYDIEIQESGGRVFTWLSGRLPVAPQVTE